MRFMRSCAVRELVDINLSSAIGRILSSAIVLSAVE